MQNASWERIRAGVDSSKHVSFPTWSDIPEVPLKVRPSPRALAVSLLVGLVAVASAAAAGATARSAARPGAGSVARGPAASGPAASGPVAGTPAESTKKALVIEGDDHLFMVSAPDGWVLDDTSGMGSRIRCVFYPKGQKWSTAPTVMYVNPLHGYGAKTRTVSTLMSEDEKAFKKRAPRGTVTEAGTIATTGKKAAHVRYFSDDGGPPHEAVAYVPESELVMLLVLSSRTPQGFQQALGAYHKLVESYAWVGSNREFGR